MILIEYHAMRKFFYGIKLQLQGDLYSCIDGIYSDIMLIL